MNIVILEEKCNERKRKSTIASHNIIYETITTLNENNTSIADVILVNTQILNLISIENILVVSFRKIKIKIEERESKYYCYIRKENRILEKIKNELKNLGFKFKYIGTKYLAEAILLLYEKEETDNIILSKKIYPKIGEKYNKTTNSVYCSIKRTIEIFYYDSEEKRIKDFFKYSYMVKPTPKEVINGILEKIKKEIKD